MAYVRYEWRELTEQGLLVKIPSLLSYASGDGESVVDETLCFSFCTEEEALEALFNVSGNQHNYVERVPDNLTLVKLVDA
jgi:hypothetical protein